jgi:hypothetical protein
MLMILRELGLAERDLKRAAKDPRILIEKEFAEDQRGGLESTSLAYQTNLFLGMVRYLRRDHHKAVENLVEALRFSAGADELAESGLWLTVALLRAGRAAEAGEVIRGVPGDLAVTRRGAELALLRLFKRELPMDSLQVLADQGPEQAALYLFGLGLAAVVGGDRQVAADHFEEVMRLGVWHTWPALAAESELAGIRRLPERR